MSTSLPPRPSAARSSAPTRGPALLVLSAVAFSTAGFFTREAPVDLWSMIVWRNLFGAAALLLVLRASDPGAWRSLLRLDRGAWAVSAASSLGTICYLAAFKFTSVADISIIYAAAPLITAALAWIGLREPMSRRTLLASALALLGVTVTAAGSVGAGRWFGDGLALLMTLSLSAMAVMARRTAPPALPVALVSSLATAAVIAPLGWIGSSGHLLISAREAAWLACFGVVTLAVAMPCYLAGIKGVPAGRAMLISALEMPLAPVWVWLAFGEATTLTSLVGGGIVAVAVMADLS